eukprot:augustus_masked-scaffold_34-processed-gene-2.32-mRNA-1 protein AED:0.32 eAED:0.32 QI:0/-1/0/1/-1/1/1/0/1354
MTRKQKPNVIKSRPDRTRAGVSVKEWQRTPKQLLYQYCQKVKRPKPMFFTSTGVKGDFKTRVVLKDIKNKAKDIVISTDEYYKGKQQSEEASALLCVAKLDGARQHEKVLPEEFKSAFLSLVGRKQNKFAQTTEKRNFLCSFCAKGFKKEFALKTHENREHAEEIKKRSEEEELEEQPKLEKESEFNLFDTDSTKQEYRGSKKKSEFQVSSKKVFLTKFDRDQSVLKKKEERNLKLRSRENFKRANPYAQVNLSPQNIKLMKEKLLSYFQDLPKGQDLEQEIHKNNRLKSAVIALGFSEGKVLESINFLCSKNFTITAFNYSKHLKDLLLCYLIVNTEEKKLPYIFQAEGTQFDVVQKNNSISKVLKNIDFFEKSKYSWLSLGYQLVSQSVLSSIEIINIEAIKMYWNILEHLIEGKLIQKSICVESEMLELEIEGLTAVIEKDVHELGRVYFGSMEFNQLNIQCGNVTITLLFPIGSKAGTVHSISLVFLTSKNKDVNDIFLLDKSLSLVHELIEGENSGIYSLYEMVKGFEQQELSFQPLVNLLNPKSTVTNKEVKVTMKNEKRTSKTSSKLKSPQIIPEIPTSKDILNKLKNSNGNNIMSQRRKLPAFAFKDEILSVTERTNVVLIRAETGAGKTSQCPQFYLHHALETGKNINIYCCQPRRLAATATCARIAFENQEEVGELIGYRIKGEKKVSQKTRLCFLTTGVLLRELQVNPLLRNVSHVIVDEVHERSKDSDFLLLLLKKILYKNKKIKLILMSATVETKTFKDYFPTLKEISIPGRTFPVTNFFLTDVRKKVGIKLDDQKQKLGVQIDYNLIKVLIEYIDKKFDKEGSVLIFLPGIGEITRLAKLLNIPSLVVYILHSLIPPNQQNEAFKSAPIGKRKVVLATNIAETSITIPDVVHVIDSGLVKSINYDPMNKVSKLETIYVSKDSAKQRHGRAGRVQSGFCYKLYSKSKFSSLLDHEIPEIKRISLDKTCLEILNLESLKKNNLESTFDDFLEPPKKTQVASSIFFLSQIEALVLINSSRNQYKLTGLGQILARLPLDVLVGKLCVYGYLLGVLEESIVLASILSAGSFFIFNPKDVDEINQARQELYTENNIIEGQSDHLLYYFTFMKWSNLNTNKERSAYSKRFFLNEKTLFEIKKTMKDIKKELRTEGFVGENIRQKNLFNKEKLSLLKTLLTAGFYPNMMNVLYPNQKYIETKGGNVQKEHEAQRIKFHIRNFEEENPRLRVFLHPSSLNFTRNSYISPWLVYTEILTTSKTFVRQSSACLPYSILFFTGDYEILYKEGLVRIDDWIILRCHPTVAILLLILKKILDSELKIELEENRGNASSSDTLELVKRLVVSSGY